MSESVEEIREKLKKLTPEQQAYIVKRVAREKEARRTLWECSNPLCAGSPHREAPCRHARRAQRWPFKKNDEYWGALWMAGRGFGKTRACSEAIRTAVGLGYRRIGLIARTAADLRDTVVEGESGVLAVWPEWDRPVYEASKARVTFSNGATALMLSAEKPDGIRGKQFDFIVFDEFATFPNAEEVLYNALMALRLKPGGKAADFGPRALFATTPRPTKAMKDLIKRPGLKIIRGRTHDNLANLASTFQRSVIEQYEGTRTGRQELDGEMLTDVEGALLNYAVFEREGFRLTEAPALSRIVVAVDPAVSSSTKSDHTGVCVVGLGEDGRGYVLGAWALKDSPAECMKFVAQQYHLWGANEVVAEVNNGGDYVQTALYNVDPSVPYKAVRASVGKRARAEPVALLYEQGRVSHVGIPGMYAGLESDWTSWTPEQDYSPDTLDACVWGLTRLMLQTRREVPVVRKR